MKYHILTLGCQMNKSDSERIAAILENLNYQQTADETKANLMIVNSCSVRQSAINRIFGKMVVWNKLKAERQKQNLNEPLITVLTGCLLAKDKKKLEAIFDLVFDIKELAKLPELLKGVVAAPQQNPPTPRRRHSLWRRTALIRGALSTIPPYQGGFSSFPSSQEGLGEVRGLNSSVRQTSNVENTANPIQQTPQPNNYFGITPIYQNPWSVFIPIMTGCNNFCSYCAVPYARGREISRDLNTILTEIKQLKQTACQEITLLGQNVNTYQPADQSNFSASNPYSHPFAALLWEIDQLPQVKRIHFTAAHPKDMSDEVIDALTLSKMVNFLHLPAQSGDDEILQKMNRHYTANDYLELIKKIKIKKPNIALGTDLIVGFPGETEKQFNNTVKLYQAAEFDISYHAKYSPRSGTVAYKFKDDVPLIEKKRRWFVLQKLMEQITLEKNRQYLNQEVEVLVDKKINNQVPNQYEGNSKEYKRVRFFSDQELLGKIVKVKIEKALTWILEGKII